MRFIVDKTLLLKEVLIAQDIITVRNAMSILSNILLICEEGMLSIKATDLKVSFETRIPVLQEVPGSTTVFAEKLLNILRSIPNGEVSFELKENGRLYIKPKETKIEFELRAISGDKFPEILSSDGIPKFELPQAEILEMINQTIFAVSDDETRYFMNGVFMERKNDRLVMVATDGRRLSYIDKPLNGIEIPPFSGVIIPPKALHFIKKLASGEGNMLFALSEKQIFVSFDNQKIASNLVEGTFPNYSRVIPETQKNSVTLSREALIEGLKRVSILAEQKSKRIFLGINNGMLLISTEENDLGNAKEEISCSFDGDPVTIALNFQFLSDPLKAMKTTNVKLLFTDPKRAITIEEEPKKDYFHVIMPMQMD